MITDTVGFIRNCRMTSPSGTPINRDAVLLHVVASPWRIAFAPGRPTWMDDIPRLMVLNKMDLVAL